MRELKNKEIIAGLVLLIILSVIAMILIVKREIGQNTKQSSDVVVKSEGAVAGQPITQSADVQVQEQIDTDLTVTNETVKESANQDVSANSDSTGYYVKATMKEYKKDDTQMSELFFYWDAYKLDAVDDLIRLQRVRELTKELAGTNEFFYYGEVGKNGQPDGNGLAIYADDAYYCGEWKNGVRSGAGMWLKIYPDKAATVNGVKNVTAHSYNGSFANDYPNGQGQEHYDYDFEKLSEESIANVIGGFKDGYYDGKMYIMTVVSESDSNDWDATAQKGCFDAVELTYNYQGEIPVWERMEEDEEDNYHWMFPKKNVNQGIFDLRK